MRILKSYLKINRLKTHQFKQKTMPQTMPDLDKSKFGVI